MNNFPKAPRPVPAPTEAEPCAAQGADESCNSCAFFQPHSTAQKDERHRGHCLRFPPVVNGVVGSSSVFPTTASYFWCGEYVAATKPENQSQGE